MHPANKLLPSGNILDFIEKIMGFLAAEGGKIHRLQDKIQVDRGQPIQPVVLKVQINAIWRGLKFF